MKIAVTGGTGLIGRSLVPALKAAGHDVLTVTRSPGSPGDVGWSPGAGTIDTAALEGVDAVVHLAGEPIGERRWTDEVRSEIVRSRVDGTALIASTIAQLDPRPSVFLSGSAIGYYGDTGDRVVDESTPAGSDFLADVCRQWEDAAAPTVDAGIPTTFLRSGVVMTPDGSVLGRRLPHLPFLTVLSVFRLGLGGRSGSGRQYMSWISIDDEVAAIAWLLEHPVEGPVNLTAPQPVTNAEFARILGGTLHRPTTVIPMAGPRLLFGRELADSLLLTSQRVVPTALTHAGYEFREPSLDNALAELLSDPMSNDPSRQVSQ